MAHTEIKAPSGKQEIIVVRAYKAPRSLVYKALTDPELIPQWWGPRYLTTKVEKMDVKHGGQWHFIQHDPEGNTYGFRGVYHEAKAPELLIYTMEWDGTPGHVLLNIDRFDERDGETVCTSTSIFETIADRDGMLQTGMEDGTRQESERIDELLIKLIQQGGAGQDLEQQAGIGRSIKIIREFNVTREKVWQSWTDPDKYMCWSGPKDYYTPYAKIDLRVGGKILSSMRGPDGKDIWSIGTYKEIIDQNRLVITDSFADEHGNVVPASLYGIESEFPLELEVDVTFEDLGGKTRMTLEHCGIPQAEFELAKEGWNQSFDKLAECLG